ERQSRTFGKKRYRPRRSHRVSYAQLVEDVGIGSRQVSNRIVAEDQPFKHRLMDNAACHFFIGPQWLHVSIANCRRDNVPVHRVEIDHCTISIGLLPKWHENKTQLAWHSSPPKAGWPVYQSDRRLYRVTSLENACGSPRLCRAEDCPTQTAHPAAQSYPQCVRNLSLSGKARFCSSPASLLMPSCSPLRVRCHHMKSIMQR